MKVDSIITEVISSTATKTKTNTLTVLDIVDKYYAGITHIIQNEAPGVIKIDCFGKLIFSHKWKEKMNSIKQKQDEVI